MVIWKKGKKERKEGGERKGVHVCVCGGGGGVSEGGGGR